MVKAKGVMFSLQSDLLQQELAPFEAKRALVVCFFGRGCYGDTDSKENLLDQLLDKKIFSKSIDEDVTESQGVCIDGYYDPQLNSVFLNIKGPADPCYLLPHLNALESEDQSKGFLMVWSELKESYTRNVLFACLVSHLLVMMEPTTNFDVSTVMFLKTLESVRTKAASAFSDGIRSVPGVAKPWVAHGRLCSPRLLFLFMRVPPSIGRIRATSFSKFEASIKKLEASLEDKIYRLFRKSRVITNISANSLLALPSTQPFVHIYRGSHELRDRTQFMFDLLSSFCQEKTVELTPVGPSAQSSLRSFLEEHIEKGLGDGFDDNVSRHGTTNHFELPSSQVWWKVAGRLYKSIVTHELEEGKETGASSKLNQALQTLKNLSGTDVKFSEMRCGKVLPLAVSAYQENLPSHYTREHHETKLAHAVALFSMHARGPMVEKFLAKLEEDCVKIWEKGRQMCEVLSLNGNPCVNPIHRLPQEEDMTEPKKSVPVMEHASSVRLVAACNCGRMQGPREDPFDLRSANFSLYSLMEIECCSELDSIDLIRAPELTEGKHKENPTFMPYISAPSGLLPAFPSWSLKCLGPSSFYSHSQGVSELMPGFLPSSSYLLPWDVNVKIEHAEKWPTVLESSKRHRGTRNEKQPKSLKTESEFTVKIFIGEEYECPRGHRFIASGPEKVLRVSGSGGVKDTATRVVGSDMPLYMACPCRTNKPLIAQLMRIHIVTPKAPVAVTLEPHVRPGPEPCPTFTSGLDGPAKLHQSSYWVLRLPYMYQGPDGPIPPPKDPATAAAHGFLLKGAFGVIETPLK